MVQRCAPGTRWIVLPFTSRLIRSPFRAGRLHLGVGLLVGLDPEVLGADPAPVPADGRDEVVLAVPVLVHQHVADVGLPGGHAGTHGPALVVAHAVVVALAASWRKPSGSALPIPSGDLDEVGVRRADRVALPVGGEPVLVAVDRDRRAPRRTPARSGAAACGTSATDSTRRRATRRKRSGWRCRRDGTDWPRSPKDQKRSATPGACAITMVSTRDEQPELCTRSVHVCDHPAPQGGRGKC